MAVFAEDKSGRVTPHISHQRHQVLPDKTLATESMSSSKLDLTIKFEALQHLWALALYAKMENPQRLWSYINKCYKN